MREVPPMPVIVFMSAVLVALGAWVFTAAYDLMPAAAGMCSGWWPIG